MQYQAAPSVVQRQLQPIAPSQKRANQSTNKLGQASQDEPVITTVTDHPLEDWQQPWIEVRPKRASSVRNESNASNPLAKRLRGRLLGTTNASRNNTDICTFAATQ